MRLLLFTTKPYSGSILRPIQAAAEERGHEVAWYWIGAADRPREQEVWLSSPATAIRWKPEAVLAPGNWLPHFFPGLKVGLFHGFCVDKRPGKSKSSTHDCHPTQRDREHFRIRGLFDLYCTQGPDTTQPFQQLAQEHGNFRVRETGWSKLDPLFQVGAPSISRSMDRPCIMFGSTFTPSLSAAPLVLDEIARLSRTGEWQWLVTLHPKLPKELVRKYRALEGPNLRFIETHEVMSALAAADVLLSDSSSIVAEFLVQIRPVVTLRTATKAEHLIDVEQVADVEAAIRQALNPSAALLERIRQYSDRIHPYRDGCSSTRVLDAVEECVELGRTGLGRRSLIPLRRFKNRRRMNYWAWR
ncbi:MAG: hypothetical protein ACI835_000566 [Planctomycetota bacterium]|jgi:hypothetical protein